MNEETKARVSTCSFQKAKDRFDGSDSFGVRLDSFAPGQEERSDGVPQEQTVVLMKGELEVRIGEEIFSLCADRLDHGELVFFAIPPRTAYTLRNVGRGPSYCMTLDFPKD